MPTPSPDVAAFLIRHQAELAKLVDAAAARGEQNLPITAATLLAETIGGPVAASLTKVLAERLFGDNKATRELRRKLDGLIEDERREAFAKVVAGIVEDELGALADENHLRLVRVQHGVREEIIARLEQESSRVVRAVEESSAKPQPERVLADYRDCLRKRHSHLLGPFADHATDLDTVFVELDVEQEHSPLGVDGSARGLTTVRELMLLSSGEPAKADATAPRWVILGDPGSGKTTAVRHLVWELAADVEGPLPVYATLSRLAGDPKAHPFDLAESDLCSAVTSSRGRGLSRELRAFIAEGNQVWLFLDGLDEVPAAKRAEIAARIQHWADDLPRVAMLVLSRPVGYRTPGKSFVHRARLQKLDGEQQLRLLAKWIGSPKLAAKLLGHLERRASLRVVCEVPLLLSLMAFLAIRRAEQESQHLGLAHLPDTRRQLLDQSLDALLTRGHGGDRSGVTDPHCAREVLGALSLALHANDDDSWSLQELRSMLFALESEHPNEVGMHLRDGGPWRSRDAFLRDVADNSGVLVDAGGEWCFFHRQFREFLAAEALWSGGEGAVLDRARALRSDDVPKWAEVLAFACEFADEPLRILLKLDAVSTEVALRVLPEVERVDAGAALTLVRPGGPWDGDFLVRLFQRWIEQRRIEPAAARKWLWDQVTPERSLLGVAYLHYALEHLIGIVDRERFFRACDRWPVEAARMPAFIAIPAGSFRLGSPETEPHRFDNEGPRHFVRVSAFELSPTAVTNREYAEFDPDHAPENFGGKLRPDQVADHPVVNVSWWEAYLYCKWRGARLPTEAEWEYACRAGTDGPFSLLGGCSGPEQINCNGNEPYPGTANSSFRQHTVCVGSLPPNRWGLYEMHGNVSEWCFDWYAIYTNRRQVDPVGPADGQFRVMRGGSWMGSVASCRAARRNGFAPASRWNFQGFRLARSQKDPIRRRLRRRSAKSGSR